MTARPRAGRLTRLAFTIGAILALAGVAPVFGQNLAVSSVRVDSIVVSGNFRRSETEIIDRSGLRVGNIVQLPQVQDVIRRLFATGDYADIQVSVGGDDPERGIFYITVEERPYITRYEFEGLESLGAGTVRDTIGLAQNAPLDPDRIARARAFIIEVLSNEGFPTARVDTVIRPDPARPGNFRFAFRVREGPRLGVTSIRFEGNEAFTDGQLRSAMVTDQEGFMWFNQGQLKKDEYRLDLAERLPEYYARHGYLDFQVVEDTVISDPVTGKGRIVVWVEEGPQYTLEELRVVGNRAFAASVIEESARAGQVETDEGETAPFNQPAFVTASGSLGDLYRNAGYLDARILPDVQRLPPAEPGENPRVAAVLSIREGDPSYFREINIEGNTYTHDRIIRNRLFIFPSDIYSQERLVSTVQAIQGLGFFEPLPPDQAVEFRQRPDGDVDVTLRVQEKQTGTVNFGVTASGVSGFAGFVGYEQPNLFGRAKSGRFRWIFGSRQQDIDVSYSDPEIFGSRRSATVTLRSSRNRFTGFSLGNRRQTGGLIEVGTPLFGLRSVRLFVGYSLFNDQVSGLDTTNLSVTRRRFLTSGTRSGLSFRLVQDTRNNPLFPTAGSRNTISLRHTGGFLGGSGNYQKVDVSSEWFVPVAQIGGGLQSVPMQFTFGMNFAAGIILGDNPFFTERYFVGGTQTGIQLRGYQEATVTPIGHIPREARVSDLDRVGESYFKAGTTFGLKLTSSIFVSAFMDAGNAWRDAGELNPTDLLVGAGLGVSLVSPFGPIGLDYAYGFDRRDVLGRPDPGWQLHFKFGRIF